MTEMAAAEFRKMKGKPEARKPESDLVKSVVQHLEVRWRAVAIRVNSGLTVIGDGKARRVVRGAKAGTADVIACLPFLEKRISPVTGEPYRYNLARFCAFECKVAPNKATKEQEAFLQSVRDRGGIAGVVYSLEDVDRLIEGGAA